MNILDFEMGDNDAGADTVRDYLKALLNDLWEQEEGFSGKRPFGNSGWQYEVYTALVKGGAVTGTIDSQGCLGEFDHKGAEKMVLQAIKSLT